uniref:MAS related GPR family member D n=2 Tax=Myotis myotis TaxID=51298 RepID=A0A7J7VIU2_MYOMY|nr:MAS related GPR family member D [Myotis myotis]
MNQTLNDSQAPTPDPSSPEPRALGVPYWVLSALTLLTCVCSLAGNGLVVWLLSCRVRRTPCTVYVLHLALADLLFLLCMASVLSLEAAEAHPMASEVLRRVKYFAYTAGLSMLTAISTLRCVSVVCPVWHRQHQSPRLSAWVCAALWTLSLVMNTLAAVFCSKYWRSDENQCFVVDAVFSVLILGIFTPVMTVSSATLFVQVRRTSRRWRRRRPTRLYVVILASVLVFLVCALPLGLYWFLLFWLHLRPQVVRLYSCLSRLSATVSCGANPVIYFLVGSRHAGPREPLEAVLQRALQEAPELEGRETPSGYNNEEGV